MPSTEPSIKPFSTPRQRPAGRGGQLGRISWLGAVSFALLVALLGVMFVQARQAQLLHQALGADDDRLVVQVLESELQWRALESTWRSTAMAHANAPDSTADPTEKAALQARFLPWQAGLEALVGVQAQALFADEPSALATLQAQARFASRAALSLSLQPTLPLDAAFLQSGLREMAQLDAPVRALSTLASARMAERARQRSEAVQTQNQWRLGLTVFLALLTALFATLALHQLRRLQQQRAALESLATSLTRARQEAEAANRAKGIFLANMSHEIRTPFQGLMGMLSLLRETGLSPKQIDYLRTATSSADHLLAILNDILDMSQLESGRLTLAPTAVDLRALLREVEALMRPQAMARQLSLHVDIAPDLPERATADPTRLKQILFNLLSNAIKFSTRGEIVLEARLRYGEGGTQKLMFGVIDQGIGIDADTLEQLFNRAAPTGGTRARRHGGGTGLGLEISRNLAWLMQGDISVTSRPGAGSRFVLDVPFVAAAPMPAAAQVSEAPLQATRRLRLLVAEDNPVNRHFLAALLEGQGHDAHYVTDGAEAVEAARQEAFDLVLMDLHMPRMDGVAATRAIRALPDPARSTVPIVALTADALDEARDRCFVAGMNDFLSKPVSPAKLAALLRQLFGSGEAGRGTSPDAPPLPPALAQGEPLLDEAVMAAALQAMPRERFAALLSSFLDQGPQTVQHLRAAVRDAQPLELRVNAHAVKGAALNLGLGALAATAQALQEGAVHLPAHEVARLVQRYENQLQATRHALQAAGLVPASPGEFR